MDPERKCKINGKTVAEFYWAGEYPVYVDSRLVAGTYEQVCERLEKEEPTPPPPNK